MPTNKQRRDAARRHLERQLERRQERERNRRQLTLITSVVGTVVIVAVIIVAIVMSSNDHKGSPAAGASPSASDTATGPTPTATPSTSYPPATGASVTFDGVTVKGAKDLSGVPGVTSKSTTNPTKLEYDDVVVGQGDAATPTSTVTVQYYGVLYKDGTEFDSSWSHGMAAQFPLTEVIPGFTQGIGGTTGVPPMKVGGRRIIIIPAALGYGAQASGAIPANASLVFVVDLKSTAAGS